MYSHLSLILLDSQAAFINQDYVNKLIIVRDFIQKNKNCLNLFENLRQIIGVSTVVNLSIGTYQYITSDKNNQWQSQRVARDPPAQDFSCSYIEYEGLEFWMGKNGRKWAKPGQGEERN